MSEYIIPPIKRLPEISYLFVSVAVSRVGVPYVKPPSVLSHTPCKLLYSHNNHGTYCDARLITSRKQMVSAFSLIVQSAFPWPCSSVLLLKRIVPHAFSPCTLSNVTIAQYPFKNRGDACKTPSCCTGKPNKTIMMVCHFQTRQLQLPPLGQRHRSSHINFFFLTLIGREKSINTWGTETSLFH